jgi:hypothetical protein
MTKHEFEILLKNKDNAKLFKIKNLLLITLTKVSYMHSENKGISLQYKQEFGASLSVGKTYFLR